MAAASPDLQCASNPGDIDGQDANREKPKRPAPPIQGGHPGLPQFPGLAPISANLKVTGQEVRPFLYIN